MRWTWEITTGDGVHTVAADISLFTGRETVTVDGRVVSSGSSFGFRSERVFAVGARQAKLIVRVGAWLLPTCSLLLDGAEAAPSHSPRIGVDATGAPLPGWAWPFVAACGVIPILTLGGAFPVTIGLVSAGACWQLAGSKRSVPLKVAGMAAITLLAWGAVLVLLAVLARLRAK
jgi:hypothetical protein